MRNTAASHLLNSLKATALTASREELVHRWGAPAFRAAERSTQLTRLVFDRYAATEHSQALITRAHALSASLPQGYIAGTASAALRELCAPPVRELVVRAPYGTKRVAAPWARVRREATPGSLEIRNGLRLATPAWSVATAFDEPELRRAREALFRAIQTGATTVDDVAACAATMPRLRHRTALSAALQAAEQGAESHAEAVAMRRVFVGAEFDGLIAQHCLVVHGSRFRLDLYDPVSRTAIEIDGMEFHGGVGARVADVRRDARLASVGVLTVRFAAQDVFDRGNWCRSTALDVLLTRRERSASVHPKWS